MPEGHVSHRNAGLWHERLTGHIVREARSRDPRALALGIPGLVEGDTVAGAEARGKHHLMRFASGRVLHTHLRMTGNWRLVPAGRPVRAAGLTLLLRFDHCAAVLHTCQGIRLLQPGAPLPPAIRGLGPDLLAAATDPAGDALAALRAIDPGREVGEAVMDQRVVAGIGNVYKSEALFLAGVDPWRPVGSLTDDEARAIGDIAAGLLRRGVAEPGAITTYDPPGRVWGRTRGEKWVYRRAHEECRRCGTQVRSRGQGDDNRTTYWCPSCQT